MELRREQGGLHTWCRHLAGEVACSAGQVPAELFFDLSPGKLPAALWGSPKRELSFFTAFGT
jgi:hypothetical protein